MKKIRIIAVLLVCLCLLFSACSVEENPVDETTKNPSSTNNPSGNKDGDDTSNPKNLAPVDGSERFTNFDKKIAYDPDNDTKIALNGSSAEITGSGATISGNVVTITTEGTYILSGTFEGQIVVNTSKLEKVRLVLNGVNITNKTSATIYVMSADKVGITLVEGTENVLTDGTKYTGLNEKDEPNACVFSKDDLTINGYGSLTINGNYNNGITCKNDLKFVSGTIKVTATNNAIKAKDSFSANKGNFTIISYDDGIKVSNDTEAEKGYILIEGGTFSITAEDDALTAVSKVTITGGTVTTYCNGKSINCLGEVNVKEGSLVEK